VWIAASICGRASGAVSARISYGLRGLESLVSRIGAASEPKGAKTRWPRCAKGVRCLWDGEGTAWQYRVEERPGDDWQVRWRSMIGRVWNRCELGEGLGQDFLINLERRAASARSPRKEENMRRIRRSLNFLRAHMPPLRRLSGE